MFVIAFRQDDWRSSSATDYLIDLRPGHAPVPIAFECSEAINQGFCGTPDKTYGTVDSDVSCEWKRALNDFACVDTERIAMPWGARVAKYEFLLLAPSQPDTDARATTDFAAFAKETTAPTSESRVIPHWGPVYRLWSRSASNSPTLVLFAAPGTTSKFETRFMLASVASNGAVSLAEIAGVSLPDPWPDPRDVRKPLDLSGTRVVEPLSVKVALVVRRGSLTVMRVYVRERTGDDEAQAVYWIGIESKPSGAVASAIRLASDTADYLRCGHAMAPPNVFNARIRSSLPFAAQLDVEPWHEVDAFETKPVSNADLLDGETGPACRITARLEWHDGFRVAGPSEAPTCRVAPAARYVRITRDGRIVPAPALKDRPR